MHHVNPILANLLRQPLRHHPRARPACSISVELRIRSQSAERAGEDNRAFLRALGVGEEGFAAVLRVHHLHGFLREGECAGRVGLQALAKGLGGFGEEGLLAAVFDVEDCEFQFEVGEVRVA